MLQIPGRGRGRGRGGFDNRNRRPDQVSNWRENEGADTDYMAVPAKDVGKIIGKCPSPVNIQAIVTLWLQSQFGQSRRCFASTVYRFWYDTRKYSILQPLAVCGQCQQLKWLCAFESAGDVHIRETIANSGKRCFHRALPGHQFTLANWTTRHFRIKRGMNKSYENICHRKCEK